MSSVSKFPLTYKNMYGSQLVAALVNCLFFGVASTVTLQYFRRHACRDSLYVKAMIATMIALATLQTIFVNHQLYIDIIGKHGADQSIQSRVEFSLAAKFICVYLISFVAQLFFATRIWILTKAVGRGARLAIVPVVALAMLQLAAGSVVVHYEATAKTLADIGEHAFWGKRLTAVQGGASAAADVVITTTLCYLYQAHRPVLPRVDSIVDRLVVYAINRAAATSVCAILGVVFFIELTGTFYFIVPTLMAGQLYVISAVSVLTSREYLREDLESASTVQGEDGGSATRIGAKGYTASEKSV